MVRTVKNPVVFTVQYKMDVIVTLQVVYVWEVVTKPHRMGTGGWEIGVKSLSVSLPAALSHKLKYIRQNVTRCTTIES